MRRRRRHRMPRGGRVRSRRGRTGRAHRYRGATQLGEAGVVTRRSASSRDLLALVRARDSFRLRGAMSGMPLDGKARETWEACEQAVWTRWARGRSQKPLQTSTKPPDGLVNDQPASANESSPSAPATFQCGADTSVSSTSSGSALLCHSGGSGPNVVHVLSALGSKVIHLYACT